MTTATDVPGPTTDAAPPWDRGGHGGTGHWRGGPPWHGRPWRRRRLSLGLPVLIALIQVWGCTAVSHRSSTAIDGLAYLLLLAGPAALVWRRFSPLATLAIALPATYAYLALGYPRGPYFLAGFVAVVTAASRSRRAVVWATTAVLLAPVVGIAIAETTFHIDESYTFAVSQTAAVLTAAWTLFALLIGEAGRGQRERFAEIGRARAEAHRARGEQARRQASEERLRIARELHDVLGHHLSLINVRAGVALHLLDAEPAQARDALSAIKLASAEALREVRSVLATLTPTDEAAPRSPAMGLDAIEDLAAEAEAAGTPVRIVRTGNVRPLPGEVERAAYRIVRESLTNVRRHAGQGAMVTLTLGYAADGLTVRVEDTGVGPAESSQASGGSPSLDPPSTGSVLGDSALGGTGLGGAALGGAGLGGAAVGGSSEVGSGIVGMRERASALGGRLQTGPGADGVGFVVEAFLPLGPESPEQAWGANA